MAELDVTYHSTKPDTWAGTGMLGILPPQIGNKEVLAISGSAANGAAATEPVLACFLTDVDCRIAVGENVTATASNSRKILAGQRDYAQIPRGHRISVIAA